MIDQDMFNKIKKDIQEVFSNLNLKFDFVDSKIANRYFLFIVKTKIKDNLINKIEDDLVLILPKQLIRIYKIQNDKLGIEVSRDNFDIVSLEESLKKVSADGYISIPIGEDIDGNIVYQKLSNFLISGATNSGKSIFIHTFIIALLKQRNKSNFKFIFIDPKRVELSLYSIFGKYIVDSDDAKNQLAEIKKEINRRYELFIDSGVKNIKEYNKKADKKLSNIFIAIDEFSDLMVFDKDFFEDAISFIAGVGSAVGINIIISTSRPSPEDVVTNKLKESFGNMVCFALASKNDSVTLIGRSGGEKLLGQGDILYQKFDFDLKTNNLKNISFNKKEISFRRLQATYISDYRIEEFIKTLTDKNKLYKKSIYNNLTEDISEKIKSISYNEFLKRYKSGILMVLVNNSMAIHLIESGKVDKKIKLAHYFWVYFAFFLFFLLPVYLLFKLWIYSIVSIITGWMVYRAVKKSASQFVLENILKDEEFAKYVLKNKGAKIVDDNGVEYSF